MHCSICLQCVHWIVIVARSLLVTQRRRQRLERWTTIIPRVLMWCITAELTNSAHAAADC